MSNLPPMKTIASYILEGILKASIDNIRNRDNNDKKINAEGRSRNNFTIILILSSNKAS